MVHILTQTSGICNDMVSNEMLQNNIEMFCNRVAGIALVPETTLKSNGNIAKIKQYGFDDSYIYALARDFAVSREVIINRLWKVGIISKQTYFDTLKRYTDEYKEYKKNKKTGFLPPAIDKGSQVGKLYAKAVLSALHSETISPRQASNYLLGLHMQHFSAIERWCY